VVDVLGVRRVAERSPRAVGQCSGLGDGEVRCPKGQQQTGRQRQRPGTSGRSPVRAALSAGHELSLSCGTPVGPPQGAGPPDEVLAR